MAPFGRRSHGLRLERIMASPRFRDGRFWNTLSQIQGLQPGSGWETMRKFAFGNETRTPPAPLPTQSPLAGWQQPVQSGLRSTWLGHSTVLLEIDGVRVLTDPVWGERASPFAFAGPKRFQPVPVAIKDLPQLDAVVISHDHYDHLDRQSVMELARTQTHTRFITSLGVGSHLEAWGIPAARISELDWWETHQLAHADLSLTAAPSQHFSGRGVAGGNQTLWSSFAIKTARHSVFFSGDTGLTPEYTQIKERLGPFDLVMLEIGAFHPAWGHHHLGPENALEALRLLGGGLMLPVHWGTFNLALHAWDEPAETLVELALQRGTPLLMPGLGRPIEAFNNELVTPWWRQAG